MGARGVLRTVRGGGLLFHCPGCDRKHMVTTEPGSALGCWTFNGDYDRPTFRPSLVVRGTGTLCHSFVTDGQIEFLSDSQHALAGQTVALRPAAGGE